MRTSWQRSCLVDYCTLSPDKIGQHVISACCQAHDIAYATVATLAEKLQADTALGQCIADQGGWFLDLSGFVYAAVTATVGTAWFIAAKLKKGRPMFTLAEREEVGKAAREFKIPEPHVLAITHVESDGITFAKVDGRNEPLIRFEGHIFFRMLSGEQRERAVKENLASQRQGVVKNPRAQADRWTLLNRAKAINTDVALQCCSWGVGQVMGHHYARLGYASVQEMVDRARSGLSGQVELMLRYVEKFSLIDELQKGEWASFARGYNGPNYKKFKYDERMAAAAAMYGGFVSEPNGMLRMGSKGRRVRELQALLIRAGYTLKEDGDFGGSTRDALKMFQKAQGLTVDGVYGPQTESVLSALRQPDTVVPGHQTVTKIKEVQKAFAGGGGGAIAIAVVKEQLNNLTGGDPASAIAMAKDQLQGVQSQLVDAGSSAIIGYIQNALTLGVAACTIAGLVYGVYGYWKSKQTVEV